MSQSSPASTQSPRLASSGKARVPVTVSVLPHLKAKGVKVRIKHWRYCAIPDENGQLFRQVTRQNRAQCGVIAPRGGQTDVSLTFPDGIAAMGSALCSKQDAFDRREGIRIALQRATQDHKQLKQARHTANLETLIDDLLIKSAIGIEHVWNRMLHAFSR